MTDAFVTIQPSELDLPRLDEQVRTYLKNCLAPATQRAYGADWRRFAAWCAATGQASLPATPMTVARFLSWEIECGTSPNTLPRRLAAVRLAHEAKGHEDPPSDDPLVKKTLQGIRRDHPTPAQKKTPVVVADLKAMVDTCDVKRLDGQRDRALLLLGFAGAFRRSELVALTVDDLVADPEGGLFVRVKRSKTDQTGKGQSKPILPAVDPTYCPVRSLVAWLSAADITSDYVFTRVYRGGRRRGTQALTSGSVSLIVKRRADAAGIPPDNVGAHSLRRGFLTAAANQGARLEKMQRVSGHRSLQALFEYLDDAEPFKRHAAQNLL